MRTHRSRDGPSATRWRLRWRRSPLGALALRSIALDFGLPAIYNPDEIAILSRALAFAKGDRNPHNFLYPTFFFYALFAWIGGSFVLAKVTGQVGLAECLSAALLRGPVEHLPGRAGAGRGLRRARHRASRPFWAARSLTGLRAPPPRRCWRWRRWP